MPRDGCYQLCMCVVVLGRRQATLPHFPTFSNLPVTSERTGRMLEQVINIARDECRNANQLRSSTCVT